MYYLAVKGHTLALKNKLDLAVNTFFEVHDRRLIPDGKIEDYKKEVIVGMEMLNRIHPRCKPINARWWMDTQTKDIRLSGVGPIHFSLYKSKN